MAGMSPPTVHCFSQLKQGTYQIQLISIQKQTHCKVFRIFYFTMSLFLYFHFFLFRGID